jgi:hypothetical protein
MLAGTHLGLGLGDPDLGQMEAWFFQSAYFRGWDSQEAQAYFWTQLRVKISKKNQE